MPGIRLSKLMADQGLCSRREADRLIEAGQVRVDGEIVRTLGIRVDPGALIELSRTARRDQGELVTIALNKPLGYVSAQPEKGYLPAVTLIRPETQFGAAGSPKLGPQHFLKLAVAGRLDIDSQGLLIFTQDGRIARKLIAAESEIEKEYLVRVQGQLSASDLALLNFGLALDGKPLKRAQVEWLNEDQLRFVLREGRKRQIRRMCEEVGLKVLGLKRVRVGRLRLGPLPEGQWRFLSPAETEF